MGETLKNSETSTRVLREEHHLIERATVAMAQVIKELEKGTSLDRRRVVEIAQSFATFVGRCHHPEEDFLLSMIGTRCGCTGEYPVRAFYEEHHHVELPLAELSKRATEYSAAVHGSSGPLADEFLSALDQDVLIRQFAWIERAVGSGAEEAVACYRCGVSSWNQNRLNASR